MRYDKTSPEDIERYGQRLVGSTLRHRIESGDGQVADAPTTISGSSKASFGTVLEQQFYRINPGNASGVPDFPDAGVELKSTGLVEAKGAWEAKERLSLNLINYQQEGLVTDFEASSFVKKNQILMIVGYRYDNAKPVLDLKVLCAGLIRFNQLSKADQAVIREDWQYINQMIRQRRAHELSERNTRYLGAGTKASKSSDRRPQMEGGERAKPRAYTFKKGFATYLVRTLLRRHEEDAANNALPDSFEGAFENEILGRLEAHVGRFVADICATLDEEPPSSAKNFNAWLSRRMLGVRGNRIAEFEKADIVAKTIHLNARGKPRESMSFPAIRFERLVSEVWESDTTATEDQAPADFRENLDKRFLFVVFQGDRKDRAKSRFVGAFFWSMPSEQLDGEVHRVWQVMKNAVASSDPARFPREGESAIAHVRPHARNKKDVDTLPDGSTTTKRCFWLNRSYIAALVKAHLQPATAKPSPTPTTPAPPH